MATAEAVRSGQLTQLTGGFVRDFEVAFGQWHSAGDCVATSSGTTLPIGKASAVKTSAPMMYQLET